MPRDRELGGGDSRRPVGGKKDPMAMPLQRIRTQTEEEAVFMDSKDRDHRVAASKASARAMLQ
jgi:hypothetical protein